MGAAATVGHAHFNGNARIAMGAPTLGGLGRAGSARLGSAASLTPRRTAHLLTLPMLRRSWCAAAR